MTISSMTGFARTDGSEGGYSWTWEAKSVNSRGLDLRFRLPAGFDAVEAAARKLAGEVFARGNLSINLVLKRRETTPRVNINRDVLDQLVSIANDYRGDAPPDIETLLTLKGVIDLEEDADDDKELLDRRDAAILSDFRGLAAALTEARRAEGERLQAVVEDHLRTIESLTRAAADLAEMQPENRRNRLRAQLDELLSPEIPLSEDRLAQEIALIVARGDIREEIDRLIAHAEAARELLGEGRGIGRRLDFLCQEFNREANTLCSKSSDLALTRIGLDLKASIERLREQIQNIE